MKQIQNTRMSKRQENLQKYTAFILNSLYFKFTAFTFESFFNKSEYLCSSFYKTTKTQKPAKVSHALFLPYCWIPDTFRVHIILYVIFGGPRVGLIYRRGICKRGQEVTLEKIRYKVDVN